jgi:hypothetical protein
MKYADWLNSIDAEIAAVHAEMRKMLLAMPQERRWEIARKVFPITPRRTHFYAWLKGHDARLSRDRLALLADAMGFRVGDDCEQPRNVKSIDWDSVDWSQPVVDIAEDAGCTRAAVYAHIQRNKPGFVPVRSAAATRRKRKPRHNWDSVDWSIDPKAIAAQLGCSTAAVYVERRRRRDAGLLPPTQPHWTESVDWGKTNRRIAREVGVSHVAVGNHRPENRPSPSRAGRRRKNKESTP